MLYLKLLDVKSIEAGNDFTIKQIESFYDQISNIQRAVRSFYLAEDDLAGKGGEAIRAFYQDCHEPFLILLHQSLIDYENVLTEMVTSIESFESNKDGYISESFLKSEVVESLKDVESTTISYTEEANSILGEVADVVTVPELDESSLVEYVQQGKTRANDLISDLHALDATQVAALDEVKDSLQIMKSYIAELEKVFSNGDLSIPDYNLSVMRESDAFRSLTEEVYGENGLIGIILNKIRNREAISDLERNNLYAYFQNEVLDDKKRKEIKEIGENINEEDIDKVKKYLNDKVLTSVSSLEEEIALIEAFLYTDTNGFDIGYVDTESRQKLEVYLAMLKDYHSAIVSEDIYELYAHTLEYQEQPNGVNEHVLKTELELKAKIDDPIEDSFFDMSRALGGSYFYDGEITYYTTTDSTAFHDHIETQQLIDKEATFTRDFIARKILTTVMTEAVQKGAPLLDGYLIINEHQTELKELKGDITVKETKEVASFLNMEFSISNGEISVVNEKDIKQSAKYKSDNMDVQVHPTESTYQVLNRWKEVHKHNKDIPYPEEAIKARDWEIISKYVRDSNFGSDLHIYIKTSTLPKENGVEVSPKDLAKEYKGK